MNSTGVAASASSQTRGSERAGGAIDSTPNCVRTNESIADCSLSGRSACTSNSCMNAPADGAGTHVSATGESIHPPHVVPSLRRSSDVAEGNVAVRLMNA